MLDLPFNIGEPNGLYLINEEVKEEVQKTWTYVLRWDVISQLAIPADVLLMFLVLLNLVPHKKEMANAFECAYPHHGFL